MGARRSLRDLAEQARSKGDRRGIDTKRLATLRRWSVEQRWQERAAAWDDHAAREEDKAFLGENRRRARRMARLDEAHGEVLARPAQELLRRLSENPAELQVVPTAELFDLAIKAARAHSRVVQSERLSRGMGTDRIEEGGDRFSQMSDDELRAYLVGVDDGSART